MHESRIYFFPTTAKLKYFPCPRIQERSLEYFLCGGSGCSGHRVEDTAQVQPAGYELGFWIQTLWEEAPGSPSSLPGSGAPGNSHVTAAVRR